LADREYVLNRFCFIRINPLDPKNFRQITILSCLGKLFTAILNERLRVFSEEAFLLEENQFGFRKSYSTTDSISTLFSFFEILKSKKKKLFCGFSTLRRRLTLSGE
jgi:hypothetical protein